MIEQLRDWIATYPGFAGRQFTLDRLEAGPWAAGIFCKGQRILARQADILGGATVRRVLTLELLLRSTQDQPLTESLQDFARWAERSAPVLGQRQTLRAEQGKLHQDADTGITTYEIRLELEFSTRENEL